MPLFYTSLNIIIMDGVKTHIFHTHNMLEKQFLLLWRIYATLYSCSQLLLRWKGNKIQIYWNNFSTFLSAGLQAECVWLCSRSCHIHWHSTESTHPAAHSYTSGWNFITARGYFTLTPTGCWGSASMFANGHQPAALLCHWLSGIKSYTHAVRAPLM